MERLLRDNLLGAILVSRGLIGEEELALALQVQEREGGWRKLGDVLLDLGYISPEGLQEGLEVQRRMAEEVLRRLEGLPAVPRLPEEGKECLLVYFQNPTEAVRWSQVLQETNYPFEMVTQSRTALERLRQQHFVLLLIEISGPEFLRLPVIARQLRPDLVIVAIVDEALFRQIRRGLWSVTSFYLVRPFEHEELVRMLENALERRRLRLQNRAMREQMEQYRRELAALTELGERLTSTENLSQALTQAMFRVVDIFGSQAGSLLLVDKEAGELRFEVMVGEQVAPLRSLRLKIGQGICGWVAQTGQPLLVPDVRQDPRFCAKADRLSGFQTRSILCVPILAHGEVIGVIEVINKADGSPFTPWDQRLLTTVAMMAGAAIERAQLRHTLRR